MLPKVNKQELTPSQFVARLFQARDVIHLRHLKPSNPGQLGSGWEHSALDSFYSDILGLIDEFVESYQGKYGLLTIEGLPYKPEDPSSFLKALVYMVDKEGKLVFTDTWLLNQLDEISTLIYKTLYKLNNLR